MLSGGGVGRPIPASLIQAFQPRVRSASDLGRATVRHLVNRYGYVAIFDRNKESGQALDQGLSAN